MKEEFCAGCIACKMTEEGVRFALILDRFGQWSFPKGHIEPGETACRAARRELAEELGLREVELITRLGESAHSFQQDAETIQKTTDWFLVQAPPHAAIGPADPEHVKEAAWMTAKEAHAKLGYENLEGLLRLVIFVLRHI